MKLLVHTCCAPCAIYPIALAKKDNFSVTGFFYNPNIHPSSEYTRRRKAAEEYFKSEGVRLHVWGHPTFWGHRKKMECPQKVECPHSASSPSRCVSCWEMRLRGTASFARENGFDAFTTTLLGSPYQDHDVIKGICERLSREAGARFYYRDFRAGFREAQRQARERGMYRQNYCGCVSSLAEKEKT